MRRASNAPRKALTRWLASELGGSRMAVAGLGWCTPPDYLQKYDDYGAPLPKHVDFILELQLNSYVTEQKLIVVRWSDVKALHAALAPTWALSWAEGYTNDMARKFAEGKTFTPSWGSCLDARVARKRLSVIATYLKMVLELSRLRTNAHVMSFIAHGRARAEAWGAKALGAAINNTSLLPVSVDAASITSAATTHPTTTTSTTTPSNRNTAAAAAQLSPFTHASTTQMQDKRIGECAAAFSRKYDVRAWLGGSMLPALGNPLPSRAREAEKNAAEAMEFLLVSGRPLPPFLDTYGIRSTSQCCRAWRPVVHQTTVLRPRSVHDLSKYGRFRLNRMLYGKSFSEIKAFEAMRDAKEGGWDGLIKLSAEGAYPDLQTLDFGITYNDTYVHFHLTPEPAARLFSSFCRMPRLLHLDLAGHSIGDEGAIALAKALQHTPHLKHLDLSENGIGDAGMVALAEAFKYIPELEFLGLGRISLKHAGATALAANFKHLSQLNNFATPSNYKRTILSRLATDLPMLQFLTVNNGLDDHDACLLGAQLGALPKLELLDLRLPRWDALAVTNMVEAANRGRGMPPHVRVTEKHTHCCEGWRKALPTHGLPEEKFKTTGMMYDSEDMSGWARVLQFHVPGAHGIVFATQYGYDD